MGAQVLSYIKEGGLKDNKLNDSKLSLESNLVHIDNRNLIQNKNEILIKS